ncbi:VOC family protein [Actinokineospora cianjurensis]|uniref:Glyoxalase-like domain-containing protein n=1 Tax=Actinokineospora cianjurensis TaxID=585224 RepID=A0A421B0X7_9PSEU|nr:VOC family protein [Actinokineospora cianjurensis]RLK57931.1 hypothetical protein CLV68_4021 [Actinokineospora cianjurensis]
MHLAAITVDCANPAHLSTFWQALLTGDLSTPDEEGVITLTLPGGPQLDFAPVPEAKSTKNRLHLDLRTTDYSRDAERAILLGATPADDIYPGDGWRVLRDPEGNEFCLLRPDPDSPPAS